VSEFFVPVALESIEPNMFPEVDLFLRSGENKFVLYKSHDRIFTDRDAARLADAGVEFLFVRKGDIEIINEYLEANAERMLKDSRFDGRAKGKIIYQTSINFVGDIFDHPEKVGDFDRSKRLIENLFLYLSTDQEAFNSLETVMSHNYYTYVHSLQVTALSILVNAEAYLLTRDELIDVGIGSILHDFGKIFVPQPILTKTTKLSASEQAQFRQHPESGYLYLKEKTKLSDVSLAIIRYHHERNNGSGYPLGLAGEAIPRSAQVAAVCDVYCLLTIDRMGRKALPPYMSIQIMRQEMKGSFNEKLLDTLEGIVCVEGSAPVLL
jgi:HD-GYP domain-containing protein (c-di-GMP phosphodiesterase class II)